MLILTLGLFLFYRAKELGRVLVDQIDKPLDRAVWWIEHIIRHPTLYAARSPVHKLNWFQYFLLDVLALYLAVVLIFAGIVYKLFACCWYGSKKKTHKMVQKADKKRK